MKLRVTAIIFYIVSVIFVIYGLNTMFTYGDADSYDFKGHIVGGDAYNYIIIGIRGAGLIGVGAVTAIIGTGLMVWGNSISTIKEDRIETKISKSGEYDIYGKETLEKIISS